MSENGKYVLWNNRKYLKTEDETHVYLKDVSDNKVKVNIVFGKDKEKSDEAIRQVKETLKSALF